MDPYEFHNYKLESFKALQDKYDTPDDTLYYYCYQYCLMKGDLEEILGYLDKCLKDHCNDS